MAEVNRMLLVALSIHSSVALAFAPTSETWIGVEPNRTLLYHTAVQTRHRHDASWQGFVNGIGVGWQARFDERTGTAHRAWGPGIPLRDTSDAEGVEASLREIFEASGLLGVELSQLKLRAAGRSDATDTWYVDFDRLVDGYPVWRGGVTARVRFGKLILFGVDSYPALRDIGHAEITAADAILIAELDGPAGLGEHTDEDARLVVLPWEETGPLEMRLVYEVRSRTVQPLGHWVSFVDARSGELLQVYNEIRFFSGTVYGTHDTRTVDGNYTTSPMPIMNFTSSSGTTSTAGEDGSFTLDDGVSWTGAVSGSYLTLRNGGSGGNGNMAISGSSPTWNTSEATQAEIDSYKFLHDVRTWGLMVDSGNDISNDRLTSRVNLGGTCNAYYDGDVNFYDAGGGCNNTGRIADVNYHEWGHGFHYYALQSGSFDGALSEGIGDIVSCLLTHDSVVAPYFQTNGNGIREVATNYSWPEDESGDTHQTGLIFAGAVWDTWEALYTSYGETRADEGEAWNTISTLLANGIKAGPTIADSYDEFVAADDDDGDLSNGTPHLCQIVEGFAPHGLGPGGSSVLLSMDHLALDNQDPEVPIAIEGSILNLAPDCQDFTLSSASAHYSTDGGANWNTVTLAEQDPSFSGQIPGLPEGSVVWYYLSALAADGTEVLYPPGGSIAPYSFYVGALQEIYCNDFEADDGGFTHELFDGEDREGADDWMWAEPSGLGGDPYAAFSGNRAWGNDLGGGRYNGQYQPSIHNGLASPGIDLAGNSTVIVQFRRWLQVEDGAYDVATVYVNDAEVWANHESSPNLGDEHTADADWVLHTVKVEGATSPLALRWELETDGGLEMGGWNVDDVCVYAPMLVQDLFGIDDFVASDDLLGMVTATWTQPVDLRASNAVVVRRADRFPETREDGDVVFDGEVAAGTVISVDDPIEGEHFYAVFAGGNDGWLTGASAGANADMGAGLVEGSTTDNGGDDNGGGGGNKDKITVNAGCGCASGSTRVALPGILALLAVAVSRRRR